MFRFKENAFLQLASMVAMLGLLIFLIIAIIYIIRNWQQKRWLALIPLLITILCFGAGEAGIFLRNIYFRSQIPYLEKAIQSFETTGSLPNVKWRGYATRANIWNDETYATFWWGNGFPAKHTALLYSSSENIQDYCKTNGWHSSCRLENNWWIIKD